MPARFSIQIARDAGFCFGVREAIEKARQTARQHGKVYMLGDIVHNERVVKALREDHVMVVDSLEAVQGASVLFRAHGTRPEVWQQAEKLGVEIVDAT